MTDGRLPVIRYGVGLVGARIAGSARDCVVEAEPGLTTMLELPSPPFVRSVS